MSNDSVNNIDKTIDYNKEPVESPRATPVLDNPFIYRRILKNLYMVELESFLQMVRVMRWLRINQTCDTAFDANIKSI